MKAKPENVYISEMENTVYRARLIGETGAISDLSYAGADCAIVLPAVRALEQFG
jgi:hypothetical protein